MSSSVFQKQQRRNYVYYDGVPYRILNMSHNAALNWILDDLQVICDESYFGDVAFLPPIPCVIRLQTDYNRNYFYVVCWDNEQVYLFNLTYHSHDKQYKPLDRRGEF